MSSFSYFQHVTPAFRTYCGEGALKALPREMDRVGSHRVVLICDPWMLNRPDILDSIVSELGSRFVGQFTDVEVHSPVPSVLKARDHLEELDADAVIALGGGSSIVTTRAATILLAEKRGPRELCTQRNEQGKLVSPKLSAPKIPNWVIPSTPITAYAKAGSAIRDPESGDRLALFDPKTRAQGVFFDPVVALTAPVGLASSAGLNAFSMSVEGIQAGADDPLADALLEHALRVLSTWLPRLMSAPEDPEPRLRLMIGALLCGQGSDYTGGGLAQALSHATGPRSSVANGIAEALLLPHTMRFNAPKTTKRLGIVASVLDRSVDPELGDEQQALASVGRFLDSLEVPRRLRDIGVAEGVIVEIVDHALEDWSVYQSPRPIDREGLTQILEQAW